MEETNTMIKRGSKLSEEGSDSVKSMEAWTVKIR